MNKAVTYNGRSYDVSVKLGGAEHIVLLVVKDFEDVRPPGMLRQQCRAAAGCPGNMEEISTGLSWPSSFPLERKGWYTFMPRPSPQGFGAVLDSILHFLAQAFKARGAGPGFQRRVRPQWT